MINEFYGEHLNLMVFFKSADTYVVTLGDVEEYAVDKEEEGLNVQELAPTEAQVEEEFSEALIVDAPPIQFFGLVLPTLLSLVTALLQARLLLCVHETLVLFVKFLAAFFLRVIFIFNNLL